MREPELGSTTETTTLVDSDLSAHRWGNTGVHVLATPALAALFEQACKELVDSLLDEGELSVGSRVEVMHIAPTPVGMSVRVSARLTSRDGRRLTFELTADDDVGPIGRGTHTRAVLAKADFDEAVAERSRLLDEGS